MPCVEELDHHLDLASVMDSCIVEVVFVTGYDIDRRTCRDSYLLNACLEADREEMESA